MEQNVLLKIEYDGSGFHGWQRQEGMRTVQGELEKALSIVIGSDVHIDGTGRTDAGVHALGQCATFSGKFGIPVERIPIAVNNILAGGRTGAGSKVSDVRIIEAKSVEPGFHARFDCVGKTYRYIINTGEANIFRRNYCYFVNGKPDISLMRKAAEYIEGTHDFACFQTAGGTPRLTTVRTVFSIEIEESEGNDIYINVTGDGFLYNMVRIITGTLVEAGLGRRSPESVKDAIEAKNRSMAGHTAPAEGLYMSEIFFKKEDLLRGREI